MGCGSSVQLGLQPSQRPVSPTKLSTTVYVRHKTSSRSSFGVSGVSEPVPDPAQKPPGMWKEVDVRMWLKSLGISTHETALKGVNGKMLLALTATDIDALPDLQWPERALLSSALSGLQEQANSMQETKTAGSFGLLPKWLAPNSSAQPEQEDVPEPDGVSVSQQAESHLEPATQPGITRSTGQAESMRPEPLTLSLENDMLLEPWGEHLVSYESIQINSWIGESIRWPHTNHTQSSVAAGDQLMQREQDADVGAGGSLWEEHSASAMIGGRLSPVPESPMTSVDGSMDDRAPHSPAGPDSPSKIHRLIRAWQPGGGLVEIGNQLQDLATEAFDSLRHLNVPNNQMVHLFAKATAQRYDQAKEQIPQLIPKIGTTSAAGDLQIASFIDNVAKMLYNKELYTDAALQYKTALAVRLRHQGRNNREVVDTISGLARTLHASGKHADAEPLYRETLGTLRRLVGKDHEDVATVSISLGKVLLHLPICHQEDTRRLDEAERLIRDGLAIRRRNLGGHHPSSVVGLTALGDVMLRQSRVGDAEALYRQAVALGSSQVPVHPSLAASFESLAKVLGKRAGIQLPGIETLPSQCPSGKGNESEDLINESIGAMEESVSIRRELQGDDHYDLGSSLLVLGKLLIEAGSLEEAQGSLEEALDIFLATYGDGHTTTAHCQLGLGDCCTLLGRYADADTYYSSAIECFEAGGEGTYTEERSQLLFRLAFAADARKEYKHAEGWLRRNLDLCCKTWGPTHQRVATCWFTIGTVLEHATNCGASISREDEIESALREAISVWDASGTPCLSMADALNNLASLLDRNGRYSEAEPLLRKGLAIVHQMNGDVATVQSNLALLLQSTGRLHEAEMLHLSALSVREARQGSETDVADTLGNLGALLRTAGKSHEAEPYLRRCIEIRQKALGSQHPDTAEAMVALASLLQMQEMEQVQEAEVLYRGAMRIREKVLGNDHSATIRVRHALGELYARTNRHKDAEACLRKALLAMESIREDIGVPVAPLLLSLTGILAQSDRYAEAELLARRAFHVVKRIPTARLAGEVQCLSALGRLYLGWGRLNEAHQSHLSALKAAERLGPCHPVGRRFVDEMTELQNAAPDYLGNGELHSSLRSLQKAAANCSSSAAPSYADKVPSRALQEMAMTWPRAAEAQPVEDPEGSCRRRGQGQDVNLKTWLASGWASLVMAGGFQELEVSARRPVSALLVHDYALPRAEPATRSRSTKAARPRSTPSAPSCRVPAPPTGISAVETAGIVS